VIVDLLRMFCVTVNRVGAADRIIRCLVLRLQGPSSHTSKGGSRSKLDESLEVVLREQQVLRLDPSHGGSKLVSEQLDKNRVREILALLGACPVVTLPIFEDLVKTRRGGLIIDQLGILPRNVEGLGNKIGDVLANQEVRVQVSGIDFLREILTMIISLQTEGV
jgi:hypothetical protein